MSTDVKTSDLVARAFEIREAVAQLNEQEKALKEELNNIKLLLLSRADEQGATRIATNLGTAIVSEDVLPQIQDWDALYQYIKDNDAWHLLQRRVNSAAYREIIAIPGGAVPGVEPYTRRDINLRAAK